MKKLVVGMLAHVDAGKTTLSEGVLYTSGKIRKLGRVDNQDAYLDTNEIEKERGITIFSKEAVFSLEDKEITLLDTPGQVDFSAEMERTLQVLDYAILVISSADGVQSHTRTLWKLLARYQIPVFLFINKMDQEGADRGRVFQELCETLSDACVDFEEESFQESAAMCEEQALEEYLEAGCLRNETIRKLIAERKVFPCYFGSALKLTGVAEFLKGIEAYTTVPEYSEEFGAKVFKIARDEQGNRLTYLKVTGGTLAVRQLLTNATQTDVPEKVWEEKVNQIRIYSGERYQMVNEAEAGTVCAVTGLSKTYAGQGLGAEKETELPVLEPVLSYGIQFPEDCSVNQFLPKLRMLEEEEPELKFVWNETLGELQAQLMGEVQIEVLRRLIRERFQIEVRFDEGKIVYKETIQNTVEGVGHFEPLRHYAEVHLLMEPGEAGSGIQITSQCSEDQLDRNWQRLICTHIEEKEHSGVLTGSALTDVKITLVSGKAHIKHTEGGDFRQATYRAIRQGLMKADNVLLEPYYEFVLQIPSDQIGRAMTDVERMCGTLDAPEQDGEMAVLRGNAPVAAMRNYQKEVDSYSRGLGHLTCNLKGYFPCHNAQEVIEACAYDPEADIENPTGSVFCRHGAGIAVPWYEIEEYMHLPSVITEDGKAQTEQRSESEQWVSRLPKGEEEIFLGEDEVREIFDRTYRANAKAAPRRYQKKKAEKHTVTASNRMQVKKSKEEYLLVDGYNIVFAWKELNELAGHDIDAARGKLMDILCNYQGYKKCTLILVFDAYKVKGNIGQMTDYHNIHVVYTKEAETADQYIEKLAQRMGRDYNVTVATSDGLEQLIIRGQGCRLLSAREFQEEVKAVEEQIKNLLG